MTTPAELATAQSDVRRTAAAALGLLLVLVAPVPYFLLMHIPFVHSSGAPTWLLLAAGLALGLYAANGDRRTWVRIAAFVEITLAGLALLAFFIFARLPDTSAPGVGAVAADFTLPDHNGNPVSLRDSLAGGPVLLVFYRGFW